MFLGTCGGLLFATLYTFYPNFLLASISHSILNFIAVYFGFFTFINKAGLPKETEIYSK